VQSFVQHLLTCQEPFSVRRDGAPPRWNDEALHRAAWDADPELYALFAVLERVTQGQRARLLFQLLERSQEGFPAEVRRTLERCTNLLLAVSPAPDVLQVFLALRRSRANHKHATRTILQYLLNHPCLEELVQRRRRTVRDCLEHALGKSPARACFRISRESAASEEEERYLRRHALRFARDPARARRALGALGALGGKSETGALTLPGDGDYRKTHLLVLEALQARVERPATVTPTNRGDLAATLVHLYRGGTAPELVEALERFLKAAGERLPRFPGRLAVVLDASASSRGYGDREYACLAQSVALARVLERCCEEFHLVTLGGPDFPPAPGGATDLAAGLLDALEWDPDVVAMLSDGYENVYEGDLARVVATLPQAAVMAPVFFCHSKFTGADDLSLRRPAPGLPELEFWHEADFEEVAVALFAAARGQHTTPLRQFLGRKLDHLEQELDLWSAAS
jgi:hypothetical protein